MKDSEYFEMMEKMKDEETLKSMNELLSLENKKFVLWFENNIRYMKYLKSLGDYDNLDFEISILEELQSRGVKFLSEQKDMKIYKFLLQSQEFGVEFLYDKEGVQFFKLKMSLCQFCERFMIL